MARSMFSKRAALRIGVLAVAVGSFFAIPQISSAHRAQKTTWTIGVSNSLIGNGWRDEMVCSARAEMAHSGKARSDVLETNGDTAQQIAQIRQMISKHDNAIIIDPNSPTALNSAIQAAVAQHIVVVIVDQFIPSLLNKPGIYQVANDQQAYGRIGMAWLVKQLKGKGNVVELQGISGASADTDRQAGQKQAIKGHPGIKVVASEYTGWNFTTGGQQMTHLLNSGKKIDGVWTSGIDYTVINAYKTAHKKFVPVVGADNNGFVHQLVTMRKQGVIGAAVTNPPPVGGVGASIALKVLAGKKVPAVTKLTPKLWANNTKAGLAALKAHYLPSQGPSYGAAWNVPPYTSYSKHQLFSCKG